MPSSATENGSGTAEYVLLGPEICLDTNMLENCDTDQAPSEALLKFRVRCVIDTHLPE